jgi:lipoprotein-anchoring transpeptidase ErfK/SrfK
MMTARSRYALRPPGMGRGGRALAATLVVSAAGCTAVAQAQAAGSAVPVSQPLVVLLHDHEVREGPDARAHQTGAVGARRPLTGVRTVLPVLGEATAADGSSWLYVRLPGRPNGHKGWIATARTNRVSTGWHISVRLSTRRVTVQRDGRAVRRFTAVVGSRATPTPRGEFFVEEAVALRRQDAGAPFALATSARSNVLQEFEGGPGQIALHGTRNLAGALGTAASHGCIRLSTRAITWLARRIGRGIPLTITS